MLDKNELLSSAIEDQNLEELRRLLKEGASPNADNKDGDTSLHVCAKSEYPDFAIAALLIEHGADPSLENTSGKIVSEICEDKDFIRFISEKRGKYLKDCKLLQAVGIGSWFEVVDLLRNQASVHFVDKNGDTALHICALIPPSTVAASYALKIAKILIQYGADPEVQNLAGQTVYDLCDTEPFREFIKHEREKYIEAHNARKQQEEGELDALLNSLIKQYDVEDPTKASAALPEFTDAPKISGINNIVMPVPQKEKIVFLSQ